MYQAFHDMIEREMDYQFQAKADLLKSKSERISNLLRDNIAHSQATVAELIHLMEVLTMSRVTDKAA